MLIFWKERLVFLSTPKTGSTSIETALESLAPVAIRRPPELKHISGPRYQRHLAPLLEKASGERFTTVALMRDPVDWLGSWWRYRQRDDIRDLPRSTSGLSFEEATLDYLSGHPGANMNVGSQARFLGVKDTAAAVDLVFRYEDIGTFVHFLEDRLGGEIILPRLNVSPKGDMHLTPAAEARLRDHFAPDYAFYNSLR
ncbi:MAG TPA: hypothetical protein PK450_04545 [Paracoccaceae bacterium]|nr:hypothetical protein [Paracoccaceae bacterium]